MNDNGYLLMTMKKTKTKYLSANVSGSGNHGTLQS